MYATATKAPNAMKASSHHVEPLAATMPIAHAAAIETAASVTSTADGIRVRNGRPFSSSSAWAPIPIARKNASTVHPRRPHFIWGASAAPITT